MSTDQRTRASCPPGGEWDRRCQVPEALRSIRSAKPQPQRRCRCSTRFLARSAWASAGMTQQITKKAKIEALARAGKTPREIANCSLPCMPDAVPPGVVASERSIWLIVHFDPGHPAQGRALDCGVRAPQAPLLRPCGREEQIVQRPVERQRPDLARRRARTRRLRRDYLAATWSGLWSRRHFCAWRLTPADRVDDALDRADRNSGVRGLCREAHV